jgi:uncharacterized protein YyaL (SSP411 family)
VTTHPDANPPTNALAGSASPYLLQHQHNPVAWHPWGEPAFDEAARRQVPVLLSVGYSTCYWCHVMERQVFEDPAIAKVMNEQLICIKVDREQHPAVDDLYMTATQLLTGQGGWPMNIFLTPPRPPEDAPHDAPGSRHLSEAEGRIGHADAPADPAVHPGFGLKPFWAGTYIPPTPMQGRPGMTQIVQAVAEAWQQRPGEILDHAQRLANAVMQQRQQDAQGPPPADALEQAVRSLLQRLDPEHGGFGGAPKFPQPGFLQLLLDVPADHPLAAQAREAAMHTLDCMALGGIYDQLAGGFHRYSTDAAWLVPHFEKMLYDNGQLLSVYATAIARCDSDLDPQGHRRARYTRVIRETAEYLRTQMRDPTGVFWSAQDAEVHHREGDSFLWTRDQIQQALDPELAGVAVSMFGLDRPPSFRDPHHPDDPPRHVLHLTGPLHQIAQQLDRPLDQLLHQREQVRQQLLAVRDQRDQPGTDDKVLASWNGLAIAGLADAGHVLDDPDLIQLAADAARAMLKHLVRDDGRVAHGMRHGSPDHAPTVLDDPAALAVGLLALHRATDDPTWLNAARRVVRRTIDDFDATDPFGGGYFDTTPDARLFARGRSMHDGATPSGNGLMIRALAALHDATGEPEWKDRLTSDLQSLGQWLGEQPLAMSTALPAIQRLNPQPATGSGPGPVSIALDHVRADGDQLHARVVLDIPDGLHVAADNVLLEATRDAQSVPMQTAWPAAASHDQQRGALHQGRVPVDLTLVSTAPARLAITCQACDDRACHPPQHAAFELRAR